MSLDTKVKIVDLINLKQTLELSRSGQLPIKYGCNFTNDENNLTYKSSSKIHDDILTLHLLVEFEYQAECGRCLSIDICQNTNSRDFSLNLNTENDYELNLDSEFVDFEPFISEMIIDKLEINYLCKINCKGLCSDCGLNMNKNDCNHDEKKLKESPFSSLSQLDL